MYFSGNRNPWAPPAPGLGESHPPGRRNFGTILGGHPEAGAVFNPDATSGDVAAAGLDGMFGATSGDQFLGPVDSKSYGASFAPMTHNLLAHECGVTAIENERFYTKGQIGIVLHPRVRGGAARKSWLQKLRYNASYQSKLTATKVVFTKIQDVHELDGYESGTITILAEGSIFPPLTKQENVAVAIGDRNEVVTLPPRQTEELLTRTTPNDALWDAISRTYLYRDNAYHEAPNGASLWVVPVLHADPDGSLNVSMVAVVDPTHAEVEQIRVLAVTQRGADADLVSRVCGLFHVGTLLLSFTGEEDTWNTSVMTHKVY